jgi:hypothetical protein
MNKYLKTATNYRIDKQNKIEIIIYKITVNHTIW